MTVEASDARAAQSRSAPPGGAARALGRGPGSPRLRPSRTALVLVFAGLALLAVLVPAAQGRASTNPALDVTFSSNGSIAVTLPDGTPVGSTSGAPSVIPAGYYTIQLSGPGECVQVPLFNLKGPGENLQSDMSGGEVNTEVYNAYLVPNSTYTWNDYAAPTVFYTFATSASVLGAPTSSGSPVGSGVSATAGTTPTSENIVGTGVASGILASPPPLPFRGTLRATVSSAGKLSLTRAGKNVASLTAGRYTITVVDRSATSGFMLEQVKHPAMRLTGGAFVGEHSLTVELSAGQWFFAPHLPGKESYFVVAG